MDFVFSRDFEYLNNEYNINIIVEFCGDGSNN